MFIMIAVLVAATIAIALFALLPRMSVTRVVYDAAPSRPCAFGYKMAWIAIRTEDTQSVVQALGLYDPSAANWQSGIGTVYHEEIGENRVFVTPPVDGWTLVVGLSLPHPLGPRFVDKWTPLIEDLIGVFPEVQYYFSYPLIDYYAWAKAYKGRIARAFAIGDEGIILKRGRITKEEKALGLKLFELRGVRGLSDDAGGELVLYPTEGHVMQLAGDWGLDPTTLGEMEAAPALGVVGLAPVQWRPVRLRQAA